MINKSSLKLKHTSVFDVVNVMILLFLALICILPLVHVASLSLSSSEAVSAGKVGLWPINFNLSSYKYALTRPRFINAFFNSVIRVIVGVGINLLLTILASYPLSKTKQEFPGRSYIAWFFVITLLVNGGMVPRYMMVFKTGLIDSIWALVLPPAVPAFCITILLNYFRSIPKELEESAHIDGAGHWRILWSIYFPLSKASLATLTVYQAVAHWNDWLDGALYMNKLEKLPLQTYLKNAIVMPSFDTMSFSEIKLMTDLSNRSFTAARIMLATLPIICIYPALQKYFIKGIMLGSVKG